MTSWAIISQILQSRNHDLADVTAGRALMKELNEALGMANNNTLKGCWWHKLQLLYILSSLEVDRIEESD